MKQIFRFPSLIVTVIYAFIYLIKICKNTNIEDFEIALYNGSIQEDIIQKVKLFICRNEKYLDFTSFCCWLFLGLYFGS